MSLKVNSGMIKAPTDKRHVSLWFRRIIIAGFLIPAFAEVGCDIYILSQGGAPYGFKGFAISYFIYDFSLFALNPFISNTGSFIAFAYFARWILRRGYKYQYFIIIGGLLGLSITVFTMVWMLIYDFHHVGQGYLFYIIPFSGTVLFQIGSVIGIITSILIGNIYCYFKREHNEFI